MWGLALNGGVLLTLYFIGSKYRFGHLVGVGMEMLWLYWSLTVAHDYGFTLFAVIFACMYLWNWWRWRPQD